MTLQKANSTTRVKDPLTGDEAYVGTKSDAITKGLHTITEIDAINIDNISADFYSQASLGNIAGFKIVTKYGRNNDIDNGADEEDFLTGKEVVAIFGKGIDLLTSAENLNIKSTDNNDKTGDTGARTVRIYGLDANYDEIEEVVNLNGTTNVLTTNAFLRVNRIRVETTGSSMNNEGSITAKSQTSNKTVAEIDDGKGSTEQLIYTIPRSKKGLIYSMRGSVFARSSSSQKRAYFEAFIGLENGTSYQIASEGVDTAGGSIDFTPKFPLLLEEKTDFWITCRALQNNTVATAIAQIGVLDVN